jgi:VanZ family protein
MNLVGFFILRLQFFILLVIYVFLGVVKIPADGPLSFNDLLMHCIGYIVLMCSIFLAFPLKNKAIKFLTLLFIFSFLIECIQYFLPYRSFSLMDMLANSMGLLIGLGLAWLCFPVFIRLHSLFR